jgi:Condensation domain
MHPSNGPVADETRRDLFPLPLTPFEYYYYLDDCREYPTTFPVELQFAGTLVREHFLAALGETRARHPMLCAVIDTSQRRPRWVADGRARPEADWADASVPVAHPAGEFIDLTSGPGLRTWVRTTPAGARVLFQFHHACCDGLSSLQFVRDLLIAYQKAAGADRGETGDLDVELLRRRGELVAESDPKPTLRDACYTARLWAQILSRNPDVLAAPDANQAGAGSKSPGALLEFESHTLDRDETAALRKVAEACRVTANDLLLRDFLLAVGAWNRRHSAPGGRLRVNVPVNVRRKDEARMPAANRIGFGFVTAGAEDVENPTRLLERVRGETTRIKEWKLGLYFLGGLAFAARVPLVMSWALKRNRSFATAVLSNVGRFVPDASPERRNFRWTCGDLELVRVTGVPPLRKLTRAAAIVIEYAGETTLSLRCDPHYFDAPQTRELLDSFVERVRETLRSL